MKTPGFPENDPHLFVCWEIWEARQQQRLPSSQDDQEECQVFSVRGMQGPCAVAMLNCQMIVCSQMWSVFPSDDLVLLKRKNAKSDPAKR